ncbi:hypothetical protein RCO38_00140 [Hydrogenophaga pseudoflava]|nr:hypothetical protein [Hydrogenophaga pseudoflava]MDQ7742752.1 hypothetical protein [Hydrogenophaga pseudoflava]
MQRATFAPETTGRIGSVSQKLMKSNGAGGWVSEDVPFTALYNALGQLTSFQATGASPVFQWGHTYTYDFNANRTGGTITANGASMSFTSALSSNRLTNAAGITVVSNAAGDITSLLGKTLAYDTAGRLSEATGVPPCPSGVNCSGLRTTTSRYNGWGQRFLRETDLEQSVFSYGLEGFPLLSQTTRHVPAVHHRTHLAAHRLGADAGGGGDRRGALRGACGSSEYASAPVGLRRPDQMAVALQRLWRDRAAEHPRLRAGPSELRPALPRPD